MGALSVFLSLLSSLLIGVLLRMYEKQDLNRYLVITANYLAAGIIGLVFAGASRHISLATILYGAAVGFGFFISFVIFSRAIRREGISVTVTIGRLSLAVPVFFSILLWGERPSIPNLAGIALIVSIILFWEKRIRDLSPLLLLLFALFGLIDTSLKLYDIHFGKADSGVFLAILFFSAFFWSLAYLLFRRIPIRKTGVTTGLFLGIPNFFSSFFVLLALEKGVPAYIIFPVINTGLIILSALVGRSWFKERLSRRKLLLILLGIAAILLLTT